MFAEPNLDLTWSGRREAPRAARQSRLAPVSSHPPINRTLGFPQSGWKRAHISSRVPHRVHGDGLLDQPSCRRQLAGWLAAFAAARGPDHEARSHTGTAPRRVIAASGTTPSLSCKQRPRSPRGPLLRRGCVVLAVIARTASAASLEPSRRLPVLRLYAEPLPCGRVLAGLQTFPTLRHRSFPWCHRLYAEEPRGCICPILPRRHWPSPCSNGLGAPTFPQLAMSTPQRGLLVGDRHDAAAIRLTLRPQGLLAPLDQPTRPQEGRAAGHLYFRAFTPKGRPPGAPDMTTWAIGKLPGRDSQGGTLARWIDAVMGCTRTSVE